MKFEWHGTKAATNLRKHGVSFDEAATVFADGLSYVFPDPDHSDDETRFLIIGMSEAGGFWLSLTRTEGNGPGSYQHGKRHERSEIFMKKTAKAPDELRPEYDFTSMPRGVRGKYAARYREGVNIVKLDDDVSAAFPDAKTVNDALRSLIRIAQTKVKHKPRGTAADL